MSFWNATDTKIEQDVVYVNNTYKNENGNNALTTITATNKTGYVPVDANSTDTIIQNLEYSIQTDGKITYRYTESGGQFNSIDEIKNNISGYSDATSARIKDSMQKNLTTSVAEYNAANPDKKLIPTVTVAQSVEDALTDPSALSSTTIDVGEAKVRKKYGNYCYPLEMKDNKQDRIIFTMRQSEGSTINPNLGQKTVTRTKTDKGIIEGSVTLPIQPSISDSNSVDWQGNNLNALGAFAAGSSLSLMRNKNIEDVGSNIQKILGGISKEFRKSDAYGDALKIYLAQEAVGLQGLLSRAGGAILNPNMELLFNAPSLRPFTFTFRLSPRDSTEATQVRNIIRFFKQGMSVKTTETSVFLKAPNVFDIRYQSYDSDGKEIKDHPSLNRIKTCALTACDVNYTPDGSYMTFNDDKRTMTSYELSLRFTELDPVYDEDYTAIDGDPKQDGGFNEIGY